MTTHKSENRIQQEMYMWFHNTYPDLRGCLFHVPNGGARSRREGALFKEIGVVPGVADLFFMYEGTTTLIEVKNALGKQSKKQLDWEVLMRTNGFEYYIVRTLEEFQYIIVNTMNKIHHQKQF